MVIVLPLGVGAAIYLTEYATNRRLVAVIEFATETLTGIPPLSSVWWVCCSSSRCWASRRVCWPAA